MTPLHRVIWSPKKSQCLAGFTDAGVYVTTPVVFSSASGDCSGLDGTFYRVVSWQPDGRDYGDRKRSE